MRASIPSRHVGAGSAAGARPDTRSRASDGLPRCHETATCVRDPGHCEPPDGRRSSSSEPGCGSSSPVVHSTPAGRIRESKKNFCCVTTRRCNLGRLGCLGRHFGLLTARALRLRVLSFDLGGHATLGLPPCRLPTTNLPPAYGILAVPLIPTLRLVLASAPFPQADPQPGPSRPGTVAALWFIVAGAHGSVVLPRDSPGRMRQRSPRALIKTRTRPSLASLRPHQGTRQRRRPFLQRCSGRKR